MNKLTAHRYGKSRVRVMKILREKEIHTVKELTVAVALIGDFETSYTAGDNSLVVATDTMKNTVTALAKEHLGLESERFAVFLAQHFLKKYPQVTTVEVQTSERLWDRLIVRDQAHPHSFANAQQMSPTTSVVATERGVEISSGVEDLLILKSTQAGFSAFPRCEYTTLPETSDRIVATSLVARWDWSAEPESYVETNTRILNALLEPFAQNFSPSVQTTLWEMAEAALGVCPQISRIHLAAPNKHCLLADLSRFGLENPNEVFVPTDEPHGQIEATVSRQ